MKKILIAMSPIGGVLFALIWILSGLKEAVMVIGSIYGTPVLAFILVKWLDFVDKHVR